MRKFFIGIICGFLVLGVLHIVQAATCCEGHHHREHGETDATTQAIPKEPIDVGNKICPVLDEKIDDKFKATYEYEGKIYNFCCAMCIDEFKKEPKKYIKKVEEELKAREKEAEPKSEQAIPKEPIDVGNKICPVSGEKIDNRLKATYEYEGKIYNFCCAACIDEFKKDPQKYIKKVEEELQTEPKEEAKEEQDEQMDSSMHQGHQHHHH